MCNSKNQGLSNNITLRDSLEREKVNARRGMLIEGGLELKDHFDISEYSFLKGDPPSPPTSHPNLWEQAKLNTVAGLFRVNNIEKMRRLMLLPEKLAWPSE